MVMDAVRLLLLFFFLLWVVGHAQAIFELYNAIPRVLCSPIQRSSIASFTLLLAK